MKRDEKIGFSGLFFLTNTIYSHIHPPSFTQGRHVMTKNMYHWNTPGYGYGVFVCAENVEEARQTAQQQFESYYFYKGLDGNYSTSYKEAYFTALENFVEEISREPTVIESGCVIWQNLGW